MGTKPEKVMIGVFNSAGEARSAIDDLRVAGFPAGKIGLLTRDRDGDADVKWFKDQGEKVEVGAAVGAAAGAGGAALWALGVAAGVLPAIGPVIAGGVLAALAASAMGGAAAGAVVGALAGLGVGKGEAEYYDEEFRKGRTIVVVKSDERASEAYRILVARNSINPHLVAPESLTGEGARPVL